MKAFSISEFQNEYEAGAFVLDFRKADAFAEGFIPGSYFISPAFIHLAVFKEIIPAGEDILLITNINHENQAIDALEKRSYENVEGWLKGGFETWENSGNKLDVIISIEADELMMDMKYDNPQVLDIRSPEAYEHGHLEDSENIPLENLILNVAELPANGIYYLYCDDGDLSLSVISCLKNQGLHNFYHIKGGFRALYQAEAPMSR